MITMTFEMTVSVLNTEQADAVLLAVNNGRAEQILLSHLFASDASSTQVITPAVAQPTVSKRRAEPEVQLTAIKGKSHGTASTAVEEKQEERPKGVFGRRGLTRKGGK